MRKRFFSLFLALAMAVTLLPAQAFAAERIPLGPTAPSTQKRPERTILRGREVQDQTAQQETVQQPEQGAPVTVQNAPAPQADAATKTISTAEDWKQFVEAVKANTGTKGELTANITIPDDCESIDNYEGELVGNGFSITGKSGTNIFNNIGPNGIVRKLLVNGGANLCNANSGTIRNCAIYGGGRVVKSATNLQTVNGVSRCYFKAQNEGAIYTVKNERIPITDTTKFSTGEVCWMLNGESTDDVSWYQKLTGDDADSHPVLDSGHSTVYCGYPTDANCSTPKIYSNSPISNQVPLHTQLVQTGGKWQCEGCKTEFTLNAQISTTDTLTWAYGGAPATAPVLTASGTPSFEVPDSQLSYKWFLDNTEIPNATGETYSLDLTKLVNAKSYVYKCEISYGNYKSTSNELTVTVQQAGATVKPVDPQPDTNNPDTPKQPVTPEPKPVEPSETPAEPGATDSGNFQCVYGENTQLTVQVESTKQPLSKARAASQRATSSNQVAVFNSSNVQISDAVEIGADGRATLSIDTVAKNLPPRTSAYPLTVRYTGSNNMGAVATNLTLTVKFLNSQEADVSIEGESSVEGCYTSAVTLKPIAAQWKIASEKDGWASGWKDDNSYDSLEIDQSGEHTYYLRNIYNGRIAEKTVTLNIDLDELVVDAHADPSVDSATVTLSSNKEDVTYTLTKADGSTTGIEDKDNGVFEITGLAPLTEYTYKATCTDTTGHTATTDVTFRTLGKTLASANVTVDDEGLVYDGTAKTPEVTVKIGENALDKGAEYELEYSNNTDAGMATVTIIGKGEYENTRTSETFKIAQKDVTVAVTIKEKTYDGKTTAEIKEVTVPGTVSGETLTYKTGLTAAFEDANAGTDKAVTLSGTPTFEGSVARNYNITLPNDVKGTITPLALTKFALPGEDIEKTYDGQSISMDVVEIEPETARNDLVSSWTKNGEAVEGNPRDVGTYTLTVKMKAPNNYTYPSGSDGTLTKTVKINKAKITPKTDAKMLIRNGQDNETVYFKLDTLFPTPEAPCTFGNPRYTPDVTGLDADYRAATTVTTAGQVSVKVGPSSGRKEGEVGEIRVTMESDNYNPATAIITVSATSKEIVKISGVSITGGSKTYDGKPVELVWNPKATVGSSNDEVTSLSPDDYKRVFSDGTNNFTDPPKKAGEYTLTVSVDTASASGLLEIPFKINKRELEWDTSGLTAVKKYDGTMAAPAVTGELKLKPATEGKGFIEGDDVQLVIGELLLAENFTHAGAHSELLPLKKVWELTGTDAGNYRFPTERPKVSAEITSDGKPGDSSGSDITLDVKDPSGKALKLVRTSGIPESAITQDLKDKGFDTETKIKAEMEKSLTADQKKNSVLYDLKLMVQDGSGWKEATAANFPAAGITVNLPYPSGTNKNDKFTIVHMFSTTANSKTAGQTETLSGSAVTNLDKAIRFKLTGLSPVLVTWTKSNTSGGNTTDKDDDKDDNDEETYRVRIADLSHGKITARPTRAEEGETVTLTVKPDSGYRLSSITVTDRRGKDVKLKEKSDTKYTFKMPARWVEVDATFVATTPTYTPTYPTTYYPSTQWNSNTTSCTGGASCPSRVFPDLDPAMWYHGSTDFVIQRGLMAGQSDGRFAPNVPLTRAMMVQILYTHAGRPIPSSSASFRDVDRGAWYENAVNWAAEQGVASGIGNNAFAPKSPVTREQLAVMLYNYASRRGISLQATQSRSSFSDSARISSWAFSAVTVMQQAGIVSGKQGYIFDPKGRASRAETAQMLWKLLN